ncbi:BatD family protein [Rickettsiales bacterium]|nr:BatD family protein [Rickettsiales bacterium]
MVKLIYIFIIALMPSLTFAASFTATVDRNVLAYGENISLQLSLEGASEESQPDSVDLSNNFNINSTGRGSNISIINGKMSKTSTWSYNISPKKQGSLTIPPIAIQTDEGLLKTQPITIQVKSASSLPSKAPSEAVTIDASMNKRNPYVNETLIYTITIRSRETLANTEYVAPEVKDAIFKQVGEPKSYRQSINGITYSVSEVYYSFTPMKAGKIKIDPTILRGQIQTQANTRGQFGQLFPRGFGFNNFKPFTIASNPITVNVLEAAAKMDPWLPLTSLKISQIWDDEQKAKVGEPLNRTITIVAEGISGSQLPSLEDKQNSDDFRIYTDSPEVDEEIDLKNNRVSGWRTETYTLIPKKSGELTLPEIKIPWWDVNKKKLRYAFLPVLKIDVEGSAATNSTNDNTAVDKTKNEEKKPEEKEDKTSITQDQETASYGIIISAVIILICLLVWGYSWKRQAIKYQNYKENKPKPNEKEKTKNIKIGQLKNLKDKQEIKKFILDYAQEKWNVAQNTSLQGIVEHLKGKIDAQDHAKLHNLINDFEASLYAGKAIDIDNFKNDFSQLLLKISKEKTNKYSISEEEIMKLNP